VVSSSLGRAYGQIGSGLPSVVALVAIVMGLNLLEVRLSLALVAPALSPPPRHTPAYDSYGAMYGTSCARFKVQNCLK
jgi:hypothetical protein